MSTNEPEIRAVTGDGGDGILIRSVYRSRSPGAWVLLIISSGFWIWAVNVLLSGTAWNSGRISSQVGIVVVLLLVAVFPGLLAYRMFIAKPTRVQIDERGVIFGSLFTPWSDVSFFGARFFPADLGYQLQYRTRRYSGLPRMLPLDKPLTRAEYLTLLTTIGGFLAEQGLSDSILDHSAV